MLNTLIVEDNAAYRQSLHQLLAGRFPSMQIAEARDGEEALRQALSRRFDLVFMDVRLPRGNGLSLTKTIKTVFVDSVVCVITSHDILEYRDAALRNGADHFMVKGETTEADIVGLVESLLRSRYIALIIASDVLSRKQLNMLLSIHWPVMIVAEATDSATAIGHATVLKPDLVLIELDLPGVSVAELARNIRARSPHATFIGMTDEALPASLATAIEYGVDYCVPLTSTGHTELVALVNSMQPEQTHH
jgi:DNA-binding NarL/FixJ family response regulator